MLEVGSVGARCQLGRQIREECDRRRLRRLANNRHGSCDADSGGTQEAVPGATGALPGMHWARLGEQDRRPVPLHRVWEHHPGGLGGHAACGASVCATLRQFDVRLKISPCGRPSTYSFTIAVLQDMVAILSVVDRFARQF